MQVKLRSKIRKITPDMQVLAKKVIWENQNKY